MTDGVLLLDKPGGPSSSTVLQAVKRLLGAKKAGHAGTLDPRASGLLPLLFGEATKFAQFGLDSDKEYLAGVRLGVATETGDAEGTVIARKPVDLDDAAIARAAAKFRGDIEQVPPMYSALKRGGRPLYSLAREGQSVERAPRRVTIHALDLLGREGDILNVRVKCSKGTYVRQLAADLGAELGVGAHLASLRRTAVGRFGLDRAVTLEELQAAEPRARLARLLPTEALLEDLPQVALDAPQALRFAQGQVVAGGGERPGACRVYGRAGALIGIGEVGAGGELHPVRLLAASNASG